MRKETTREDYPNCPFCGANLQGDPVPLEYRKFYEGTHYSKLIGVEDPELYDGVSWWMCPICEKTWDRYTGIEVVPFKQTQRNISMKILNNNEKEFCKCLGSEYQVHTDWGLQYCLLTQNGKECSSQAISESNKQYCHSKEALVFRNEKCPKCGSYILLLTNHP